MTENWMILTSAEDRSVNFVLPMEQGSVEARYVRRSDDYFIAYLSSHTGCSHACRMCHLTATGQTYFDPVDTELYIQQALKVLHHYHMVAEPPARMVHYNWMARGEALSNPHFVNEGAAIIDRLSSLAEECHLVPKFNVSTIIPNDFHSTLRTNFAGLPLDFYYSIYSMDDAFRKRWLPKALPVNDALCMLHDWQKDQKREIVLHWAFIAGENDSERTVQDICDAVENFNLKVRVNVVRYNPPNNKSSESPQEVLERNLGIIQNRLSGHSKIVPRVGRDIFASCGTFVPDWNRS